MVRISSALAGLLAWGLAAPAAALPACLEVGADCALREVAALTGVRIGAAIEPFLLDADPLYAPALARDFDSVTAENAMKWDSLHPEPDRYDFAGADRVVEFAEANGMTVRGHTLLWDQEMVDSSPAYLTSAEDPAEVRALMEDHIRTVVGRYRGRVDAWDVVNEPLETFGVELYANVFFEKLGPEYVAEAFHIAHEADPDATLFLNETLIALSTTKFDAMLAYVQELLADGVPVHGVGFQGHFPFVPAELPADVLQARIQAFADLGLVVEITELDIGIRVEEGALETQGRQYFDVVSACLAVAGCDRITTWGFTDRYTWYDSFFGPDRQPLPLDADFERKPAWFGIRDAFAARAVPEPGTALLVALGLVLAGLRRDGRQAGRRPTHPGSGS